MDNRITKTRLSDFLSYEWILMIIVAVIAVVVWELAYTIGAVRLTVGQEFKYYYDQSLNAAGSGDLYSLTEKSLSYDVLKYNTETLNSDYNVLSIRLSIQEGDVLITDSVQPEKVSSSTVNRAKFNVDNYSIYDLDKMLSDARAYLKQFVKDGAKDAVDAELDYANFDEKKIESYFLERMKGDNRFRSDKEKADGIVLEKGRIETLAKEVKDFNYIMTSDNIPEQLFFTYTKHTQQLQTSEVGSENEKLYTQLIEKEKSEGRENARYGINVEYLTGGKNNPSKYFKLKQTGTEEVVSAKNVVIMAFDFYAYQPHLQFETISFINAIIRDCSNFLPA